nr:hypothetical protein [Tanacetum cinerariifolium]
MTMVINREFEKLESIKISDVSLTCNTSLEIFNVEFNRMSRMEDDLFTYEVEIAEVTSIPCDLEKDDDSEQQMSHESDNDMKYDPFYVEFTEWLASKKFNYKTIDHYTMKAFGIYWARDILTKDINGFKTYEEYKDDWIYKWNKDVPWVKERPWTENGKDDGYCNGWNSLGAYIIGNTLCYQDLEWYIALKDVKLKVEALKNKPIIDGMIDEDNESSNEGWKRWDNFDNTNRDNDESENEIRHEVKERSEGFDDHERPICNIRIFKLVKYSFRDDEEYMAIKENEYDDLRNTSKDTIYAYQEIFRMMDNGWMVTRTE